MPRLAQLRKKVQALNGAVKKHGMEAVKADPSLLEDPQRPKEELAQALSALISEFGKPSDMGVFQRVEELLAAIIQDHQAAADKANLLLHVQLGKVRDCEEKVNEIADKLETLSKSVEDLRAEVKAIPEPDKRPTEWTLEVLRDNQGFVDSVEAMAGLKKSRPGVN